MDLPRIIELLDQAGYSGMLTIELDYLHSDYENDVDGVLGLSIANLRKML